MQNKSHASECILSLRSKRATSFMNEPLIADIELPKSMSFRESLAHMTFRKMGDGTRIFWLLLDVITAMPV